MIDGDMTERGSPLCFWSFNLRDAKDAEPYIDPILQQGTTPLVKLMKGIATRNFRNYHHRDIVASDFTGPRAILDGQYKLVIREGKPGESVRELFNLQADRAETNNLSDDTGRVTKMERQLRQWQESVLNSLTGADY